MLIAAIVGCGRAPDRAIGGGVPKGPPIAVGASDAGTTGAGSDAGTDGGADAGSDGGCAGALARPVAAGNDRCFGIGQPEGAELIDETCNATLFLSGVDVCNGELSGPANAFNGGCGNLACSSSSLPGRIVCQLVDGGTCNVDVCASSTDSACQ
jgi:hypothetical protein